MKLLKMFENRDRSSRSLRTVYQREKSASKINDTHTHGYIFIYLILRNEKNNYHKTTK